MPASLATFLTPLGVSTSLCDPEQSSFVCSASPSQLSGHFDPYLDGGFLPVSPVVSGDGGGHIHVQFPDDLENIGNGPLAGAVPLG